MMIRTARRHPHIDITVRSRWQRGFTDDMGHVRVSCLHGIRVNEKVSTWAADHV